MKILIGQQDYDSFRRKKVKGVNGFFKAVASAANVPIAQGDVDFTKAMIQVKLFRNGRQYEICNGPLLPLIQETAIGVSAFAYNSPVYGQPIVLTAAGAGVNEIGIYPFNIDFGGIVDLRADDELVISFQSTGADATSAIDANSSYYVVNIWEGAGFELGLPTIKQQVVMTSESTRSYPVDGKVNRVVFINCDKTTNDYIDQVIQNLNVNNEDLSINDTYEELLAKNATYMSDADFAMLGQSMILFRTEREVANSEVQIQFNSANVASGKNFLVWRLKEINVDSIERARQSFEAARPTVAEIAVAQTGRPLVN